MYNSLADLTPSTLNSCSYKLKMYLIVEDVPFHMVKTVFKYSFLKRRCGVLNMAMPHITETLNISLTYG